MPIHISPPLQQLCMMGIDMVRLQLLIPDKEKLCLQECIGICETQYFLHVPNVWNFISGVDNIGIWPFNITVR